MSCNCEEYIDCGQTIPTSVGGSATGTGKIEHSVTRTKEVTNLPITFLEKTNRKFIAEYSESKSVSGSTGYIVNGCVSDTGNSETLACDSKGAIYESHFAKVIEDCVREINIPYYIDRYNDIFVYKSVKEDLKFDVSSGGKTATFREGWAGGRTYSKICLLNTIRTKGTEKFIVVKGGIETILATQEYNYNPFPENDIRGGIWGNSGNVISKDAVPDTLDVSLILILPLVGKKATTIDPDVLYYNFYDYNATDGGFIECELPKDDGGKDYFYPYWCRQMPIDELWRKTADERYESIYKPNIKKPVEEVWNGTELVPYRLPFGSFAIDSKEAFIYSCLCQFSDRSGGSGVVVNYSSFGDLYKAIYTDNQIPSNKFHNYYPVSPL